jgi:hypothetical protein
MGKELKSSEARPGIAGFKKLYGIGDRFLK